MTYSLNDDELELVRAHARQLKDDLLSRAASIMDAGGLDSDAVGFPLTMTMLSWVCVEMLCWVEEGMPDELPREERRRRVYSAVNYLARGVCQSIFGPEGDEFLFDEEHRSHIN